VLLAPFFDIACSSPAACFAVGEAFLSDVSIAGSNTRFLGQVAAFTNENGTVTGHNVNWIDQTSGSIRPGS
jgi:hypothetical protein